MSGDCEGHQGSEADYRHLIEFHQIVTTIASVFVGIPMDEIDQGIEGALKSIGQFIGAHRGQVFILNGEKSRFDSTHEWHPEGTDSHRDRMQNVEVESFPWYMDNLRRFQSIVIRKLEDIPEEGGRERRHLESMGIRSSVAVPLSRHGNLIGFMAFDSPDGEMSLPGDCVALLAVVGEVFAGAMDRRRMNQALRDNEESMTAVEDITDRERAEQLLRIQRDVAVRIGSTTRIEEALDYLLEAVSSIDGIDCGGFYRVDQRSGYLDLLAHRGLSDDFIRNASHYAPDSPNTRIVMGGEPVYATYSNLETNQGDVDAREGLKGIAIIPVKHERAVIGALNIASRTHEEIPLPARDMLEAVAAQLSGLLGRFKSEEALRESEGLHRLLAENISDVIWTMDVDFGKIRYMSPSIRNLTGFTPGEAMRMSLEDMLAPESLERARVIMESIVEELKDGAFETLTAEMDLVCRDGVIVPVETRISVVYADNGNPLYILGVTRDVSERKRLEEQLRQSVKMQAIGELAGGIAHEFNNMLTGILGYANMLRLTAEPGTTVHDSSKAIERAAERASDLTRKLLGFARRGRQRREPVDAHAVIREVISLLQQTVSERIHLSCEMNAEDIIITGDPAQVEQVLLNLALNARDAMPSGGELVFKTGIEEFADSRSLPEPDIRPGRFAVLTVEDTGTGIKPENMERIFEPFFTTKGKGRGTGMGLAMIYGTVRNHGGFIRVDSAPGKGATFRVYLPLESDAVRDEEPPPAAPAPDSGTGRILVVDDEETVRDVARSMLEICGYEVVTVSNGLEAVDYYRDHGGRIDLVVIDMVMPEMNGRECFRALREMDPNIRAVLSTGYGADGEAKEIVQEGMAGLVLKPFSKGALAATVQEALSGDIVPAG
ncbi:MAG: response regulator [bacterium]|jgi:PAS domain S-box-containing protein